MFPLLTRFKSSLYSSMVFFFSFIKSALFQFVSLQVDVLFKLIKGLIKDLDETPMDEVCQSS